MLDLTQITKQMQGMSQHLSKEAEAGRQRLEIAQKLLEESYQEQTSLTEDYDTWFDRILFNPDRKSTRLNSSHYS